MEAAVFEYIDRLIDSFLNPQKRVFAGYMISALAIAFIVVLSRSRGSFNNTWRELSSPDIWWSKSARSDYLIMLLNQVVMMGILPRLVTKLAVATVIFEAMHIWFDGRPVLWEEIPIWTVAAAFTLSLFLLDDAAKYLVHRILHGIPFFWCFHKVHHTAETLTPFTVYRTHPVEGIIFALRSVAVQSITTAGFVFFFGDRAELVTVLGANVFLFAFNAAGSNLRHSHVWISYGRTIERFLISPAQHQLHHSVERCHGDANFGAVLAIWDRLGGSLQLAGTEPPVRFGLSDNRSTSHDMANIYLGPFIEAIYCLHRSIRKGIEKMSVFRNHRTIRRAAINGIVGLFCLWVLVASASAAAGELNIYSHRQPFLIKPFIEAYKDETGTKINIVYASKGLAQRLQAEGARSPADVILTVDIARLYVYSDKGLLAPVESQVLLSNIPTHLRAPDKTWFAFSKRARVIAIAKSAQDAFAIKRYEDLADPRWRGRVCSRPGSHVYNRALLASMINAVGAQTAEDWAAGVMKNLARRPQGNDRAQVKAIFEGVCDIAIINNYYYGKLKHSDKAAQRDWAEAVRLIFPNQDGRGTHVNISGGGVAKHSKNKAEAIRFLEFLTSSAAQDLYGSVNYEYPVNPAADVPKELRSWGVFSEDKMPIARIAELAPKAQMIIDRVGW